MRRILLSEKIRRAPWFLTIEPYLRWQDCPISSHPEARQPLLVPLVVIDYGSLMARIRQARFIGRLMRAAVFEMWKSASSIRSNPLPGKKQLDPQTLAKLEEYVKSLGIAEIGYTVVNPRYIFRGFRILHPNALVFTIEMERGKIKQAPSVATFIEIFRTYHRVGVIVNKVADFLRARGYSAHAGPALGGDVNYVPLAIDAGLGAAGKHGLLITRAHGPRVRLAAVYTDIENLPFARNNSHAWVRDFCEGCHLCVQKCPAGAISPVTRTLADGGPAFVDHTRCAMPFSNDHGCTVCIKFCPFSVADYDQLKMRFEARAGMEGAD